jgi:hypothetical protein
VVEKGVIYLNINIEVKECHTKQKWSNATPHPRGLLIRKKVEYSKTQHARQHLKVLGTVQTKPSDDKSYKRVNFNHFLNKCNLLIDTKINWGKTEMSV